MMAEPSSTTQISALVPEPDPFAATMEYPVGDGAGPTPPTRRLDHDFLEAALGEAGLTMSGFLLWDADGCARCRADLCRPVPTCVDLQPPARFQLLLIRRRTDPGVS